MGNMWKCVSLNVYTMLLVDWDSPQKTSAWSVIGQAWCWMAEVEIQRARTLAEHSMPHCLNPMPCSTKIWHSILYIIHGHDSDNGRFSLLKKKPKLDNRYVCNTVYHWSVCIFLFLLKFSLYAKLCILLEWKTPSRKKMRGLKLNNNVHLSIDLWINRICLKLRKCWWLTISKSYVFQNFFF